MMWPNVEEIVETTLSCREPRLRRQYPGFGYAPGAHKRICDKVFGVRLQIVREDQIVDVIYAAVKWEEQVMMRAQFETAWSMWQEAA